MSLIRGRVIRVVAQAAAGAAILAMTAISVGQDVEPVDAAPPTVESTAVAPSMPAEPPVAATSPTTTAPAAPATPTSRPVVGSDSVMKTSRPGVFEEFHMRDADLRGVLELLSRQGRVNIIASKEVTGKVAAVDLYEVTFEEALDAVLRATGYVYYKQGNSIYVCTTKQLADLEKSLKKLEVRPFRLSYITSTDAKVLVDPALSADGKVVISPATATGLTSSSTDAGGKAYAVDDVLIVKDYKENLDRIGQLLAEVDVKPEQVLIEATILRATLTENNQLGVDFNLLAGVDFDDLSSTTNGLTDVTTGTDTSTSALNSTQGTFSTDLNSALDSGGMTVGFISNNVGVFIRALETVNDVTIMANPKLLVINKQHGEVKVGSSDGYYTTTTTETSSTQTVEMFETGILLSVRPFIGRDGYVRMEIHPEDSSGGVATVGDSVLPSKTTTEVTSNVLVRDGHTIVIGGLFREQTTDDRGQIPLLGNIPYAGTLFRRNKDATIREEVIILITPHIIRQQVAEAVSEQLKDDVERFRIGQRNGLMWFGRDRLSQTYMRWAKEEMRAGNRDKALWNIDMALSLQPRTEEAIRLKERLTDKAYWADQSQYSSASYIVQRMIMADMGRPVQEIIPPAKPLHSEELPADVRGAFGIEPRRDEPLPEALEATPLTDLLKQTPTTRPVTEPAKPEATSVPSGQ